MKTVTGGTRAFSTAVVLAAKFLSVKKFNRPETLSWVLISAVVVAYLRTSSSPPRGVVVSSPSAEREVDPTRWRGEENEWVC